MTYALISEDREIIVKDERGGKRATPSRDNRERQGSAGVKLPKPLASTIATSERPEGSGDGPLGLALSAISFRSGA